MLLVHVTYHLFKFLQHSCDVDVQTRKLKHIEVCPNCRTSERLNHALSQLCLTLEPILSLL